MKPYTLRWSIMIVSLSNKVYPAKPDIKEGSNHSIWILEESKAQLLKETTSSNEAFIAVWKQKAYYITLISIWMHQQHHFVNWSLSVRNNVQYFRRVVPFFLRAESTFYIP